jgi:hypothetical protein
MEDGHGTKGETPDPHRNEIMIFYWINLWVAIAMSLAVQTLLKAGATSREASTAFLSQVLDHDEAMTPIHVAAIAFIGCGVIMLALAAR